MTANADEESLSPTPTPLAIRMERGRRATIESAYMSAREAAAFEVYYGMGDDRSLDKLAQLLADPDISVFKLKRWSVKYKWPDLLLAVDMNIVKRIADRALPIHVDRMESRLKYLADLEDQFFERVEKGEIVVDTLDDYIKVLKTNQLLMGEPTERGENVTTHRYSIELTDKELKNIVRLDAARKHGLPPVDVKEQVTYEHDGD